MGSQFTTLCLCIDITILHILAFNSGDLDAPRIILNLRLTLRVGKWCLEVFAAPLAIANWHKWCHNHHLVISAGRSPFTKFNDASVAI